MRKFDLYLHGSYVITGVHQDIKVGHTHLITETNRLHFNVVCLKAFQKHLMKQH